MTVYVPMVMCHGPPATAPDGTMHRVTFHGGALGALLVYETREAAEAAEPGAHVWELTLAGPRPALEPTA
ncbi:MAG: hypothetical protein EKK55_16335 [Rhodocyclaceae bacterium]|nr:MAG: hypothetical protein EKK55_16335 [Rhodocyclaceae bacterium]